MTKLFFILLIAGVGYAVYRIGALYNRPADGDPVPAAAAPAGEADLPALSPQLEQSLATATAAGPAGMKAWLDANARSVPEPRLSAIQLDYAQMLVRGNPAEARRVFQSVKSRTAAGSPLAARVARLARTFE